MFLIENTPTHASSFFGINTRPVLCAGGAAAGGDGGAKEERIPGQVL